MKLLPSGILLSIALLTMNAAVATPHSVFFSGHSLLDEPVPAGVALVARSLGLGEVRVRAHTPAGSSIRDRLAAGASAIPGPGFDAMVVTEQHTLVGNLVWNDSVGQLRRLRSAFAGTNPAGRAWLYAPWLPLDDRTQPRRWIAYERAASPVWRCLAAQADGVAFLPASAVLAGLVERVARNEVPGVRIDSLFSDAVHLTPLGAYFMSLVVFGALFERSPEGAAAPAGVDAALARSLQRIAWEGLRQEPSRAAAEASPNECGARLRGFVGPYAAYVRDVIDRPAVGTWRAWVRWARHRVQWHWALRDGFPKVLATA